MSGCRFSFSTLRGALLRGGLGALLANEQERTAENEIGRILQVDPLTVELTLAQPLQRHGIADRRVRFAEAAPFDPAES